MCKLCLRTPVNHLSGLYKRKGGSKDDGFMEAHPPYHLPEGLRPSALPVSPSHCEEWSDEAIRSGGVALYGGALIGARGARKLRASGGRAW